MCHGVAARAPPGHAIGRSHRSGSPPCARVLLTRLGGVPSVRRLFLILAPCPPEPNSPHGFLAPPPVRAPFGGLACSSLRDASRKQDHFPAFKPRKQKYRIGRIVFLFGKSATGVLARDSGKESGDGFLRLILMCARYLEPDASGRRVSERCRQRPCVVGMMASRLVF